jgi:hypothetical protein
MKKHDGNGFVSYEENIRGLGLFEQLTTRPKPALPEVPARARREAREHADSAERERAVLEAFTQWGPMTPDKCAERMGLDKTQVRPRCTQLADPERYAGVGQRPPLTVVGDGVSAMGNKQSIYDLTVRAEAAA